jgi:hypothetical protein
MNQYLINAIKRIIVPSGLSEIKVQVGNCVVTVKVDGTSDVSLRNTKNQS